MNNNELPLLLPHDWRYAGSDTDKFYYRCDCCGKESKHESHDPCPARGNADGGTGRGVSEKGRGSGMSEATTEPEAQAASNREKDARNRRIHEELMGFCAHEWEEVGLPYTDPGSCFSGQFYDYKCSRCGDERNGMIQPPSSGCQVDYTTDPAAMMAVCKKFETMNPPYVVRMNTPEKPFRLEGQCRLHIANICQCLGNGIYHGRGESLPEAVANAVIAFLDWKKGQGK